MEDLAAQLKSAREERKWSQSYLARRLNVDDKTIGRWERREANPQSANLEALRMLMPELASATVIEELRAEIAVLRSRVDELERKRRQHP